MTPIQGPVLQVTPKIQISPAALGCLSAVIGEPLLGKTLYSSCIEAESHLAVCLSSMLQEKAMQAAKVGKPLTVLPNNHTYEAQG